jgi:archaetidylinositol phosphate synthase
MPDRKPRVGIELLCEFVYRPAAHLVVRALLPLRVPPPAVVLAGAGVGLAGAWEIGRGEWLGAALLLQLKTVLDNADGQLARASGRMTALGRYLDSECDLLVDAAIFAALGLWVGPWLALVGFLALTTVLNVNFNVERLYRREHGERAAAMADERSVLARVYAVLYAPQDRWVEWYVDRRVRGRSPEARLAWHDRATVGFVANFGLSTQLAALGVCLAAGNPRAYVFVVLGCLATLVPLAVRRELLAIRFPQAVPTVD